MAEQYSGNTDDRRYRADFADVLYSARRCIHAEECVRRLQAVFDRRRIPWIEPNGASADALVQMVVHCPSGALHVERKDGGDPEPIPLDNRLTLWKDGPLQFTGDLELHGAKVEILSETRVTLCRCGDSKRKPFCDNAHEQTGFSAVESIPSEVEVLQTSGGKLKITATPDGPYEVKGSFEIYAQSGEKLYAGTKTWLCRCGNSSEKPFCDSTHRKVGFAAK